VDDKEPQVDLASEPKIDNRFGVKMDRKVQSSRAIKIGMVATVIGLTAVLMIKSPEKTARDAVEIKPPEASQVSVSIPNVSFDSYSAPSESERIKGRNKKRAVGVVVRLPGLQKLDRKHTGDIPPGSTVKAVLITGASNGPVRAEVKESLQVQGETMVPAGATLLGAGQSGDDRLIVRFNQIIFKDGSFDTIQAQAADSDDKIAGLHGSRVGSYAVRYGAAIGLNFVGGMAEGLQDRDVVGQQVVTRPDAKNALLNGTSKATLELAQDTMSNIKSKPPVIEVPAGKEILVIFEGSH
jgi:type IV secretory pathway VirB10-like protein